MDKGYKMKYLVTTYIIEFCTVFPESDLEF